MFILLLIFLSPSHLICWLASQEVAAAEEGATRKQVALAAAEKGAKKAARDAEKAAAELAGLEGREEARIREHVAAQEHSFELQAALEVKPPPHPTPPRRACALTCPTLHALSCLAAYTAHNVDTEGQQV